MKTTIKTIKGANVNIEFTNNNYNTEIVGGPKFKKDDLNIFTGKVCVGSYKNQPAELILDAENTKKLQILIDQVKAQKKVEKQAEYQFLIDQLDSIDIVSGDDDDEAQKLINRAKKFKFYQGEESEGLNLSLSRQKNELISEAQKHCNHQLEERLDLSLTADVRKKATKTVNCCKCGLSKSVSSEEEVKNPFFN